jgi:N-hydroxyarylamine O-acetyltransferase
MSGSGLDLPAYLSRIHWSGALEPTLQTLAALQQAHLAAIPFENLDVQMGRPIRLDVDSLQAKLVRGHRGGYCFEQNSLFAEVLAVLGFCVTLREARVRRGAVRLLPRTHLALQVELPQGPFLADVGFGGDGPLAPVPMDGEEVTGLGEAHRVRPEGGRRVLQLFRDGEWMDLYALEPGEIYPVDLEMANHYTSTHADSRFVQTLTVQLSRPEARWLLRNLRLTVRDSSGESSEEILEARLLPLLRDRFGLELPAGVRFRALTGDRPSL